jgi:hypothetical protein
LPVFCRSWSCLGLLVAGCSSDPSAPEVIDYEPRPVAGSRCNAVEQARPIEGQTHRAECSPLSFGTNPPSSGDHYPVWPRWARYSEPVPRGYWVHSLEHGGVVVSYSTRAAADDVAAATSWFDALAPEPVCASQGSNVARAILTPDPLLDVAFAASAWGRTLRADCFEREVFEGFYLGRVGRGPEGVCADGRELRDGGALALPDACGETAP